MLRKELCRKKILFKITYKNKYYSKLHSVHKKFTTTGIRGRHLSDSEISKTLNAQDIKCNVNNFKLILKLNKKKTNKKNNTENILNF